jgi:ABC-type uncharacterized transport system substrate-binding protein
VGGDPVAAGIVNNLNRPEGNVTGVSFYTAPMVPKRLELARELVVPGAVTKSIMSLQPWLRSGSVR